MKKVGFIAASVGTAVLLAAGAVALTTTLLSPNHGVEQANAVEVAPVAATQSTQSDSTSGSSNGGGWFSRLGGGAARSPEAASAEGERQVLPGITSRAGDAQSSSATATPSRASSDDDDDDDDDD